MDMECTQSFGQMSRQVLMDNQDLLVWTLGYTVPEWTRPPKAGTKRGRPTGADSGYV
jgi:hypothetical protein